MQLPRKVSLCGFTFKVTQREMDDNNLGESIWSDKKICIDSRQNQRQRELTLMHEMVHMALDASGIAVKFANSDVEMILACLDTHFFPLLKFNPKFQRRL